MTKISIAAQIDFLRSELKTAEEMAAMLPANETLKAQVAILEAVIATVVGVEAVKILGEPLPLRSAPFSNCRFVYCDLPGQCVSEGKCHHPAATAKATVP